MLLSDFLGEFHIQLNCKKTNQVIVGRVINSFILEQQYLYSILTFNNPNKEQPPLSQFGYLSQNPHTSEYENMWVSEISSDREIIFFSGKVESNDLVLYRYNENNNPEAKNHISFVNKDQFNSQLFDIKSNQERLKLEAYFKRVT